MIVTIALLLNIVVAGSIGTLLLINHPSMDHVYGPATPARSILLTMYIAIAAVSLLALTFPPLTMSIAITLFSFQIVYKVATLGTVGIKNPVVISNLLISIILAVALYDVLRNFSA